MLLVSYHVVVNTADSDMTMKAISNTSSMPNSKLPQPVKTKKQEKYILF